MIKFDIKNITNLVENRICLSEFEIGSVKIGNNFNKIPKIESTMCPWPASYSQLEEHAHVETSLGLRAPPYFPQG